jgi:hypothetical protein
MAGTHRKSSYPTVASWAVSDVSPAYFSPGKRKPRSTAT